MVKAAFTKPTFAYVSFKGARTARVMEELTLRSTLCAALRSAPDATSSLSERAVRQAASATRDSSTSAQPGVRTSVRLHVHTLKGVSRQGCGKWFLPEAGPRRA